ncbi:MAG: 5'-nucleotidase C-terminal domain-containing protein [Labilithrix sp.]|nr:5'-nucleotidase C-terminal domain-containing protein [Labilithrix sp.]
MLSLRIIAVNDVYALDNLPRLRTLVEHWTNEKPADQTIVTLAGDFVSPSLLSSLDYGRGMVDCMNAVGVTHAVLGNHEDDIDIAELGARVRELRAKCLGTNVRGFDPPLPTHDILEIERAGRVLRVGLVGVVMDDANAYRRPPFGGDKLESPQPAALRESTRLLREEGCACVIAITHQTIAADRALARAGARMPVIVGGHEHQIIVEEVDGTQIVKAGADAHHAAVIDLVWTEGDDPVVLVRMESTADYAEDAGVRARVEEHLAPVHEFESIRLVDLAPGEELSSVGTRARQTTMGTFVCSNLRDAFEAQGCLFNGGGIRGMRVHEHELTYGDLQTEVPFDNPVVVVRMPGRVIRDAVAESRSRAPAEFGGFLQVDDRMTVDAAGVVTAVDGAPIDLDAEYRIAIVRALFDGLDANTALTAFARAHPELIPPADSGRETKLVLVDCLALDLWKRLGAFSSLDRDGDGAITRDELAAALGTKASSLATRVLMDALDRDGDGAVTRDEADEA